MKLFLHFTSNERELPPVSEEPLCPRLTSVKTQSEALRRAALSVLRRHFHTNTTSTSRENSPSAKSPAAAKQAVKRAKKKNQSSLGRRVNEASAGRQRVQNVTSPGVQQTRKRAKSPELRGECFTSFYCFSLFIFIIAMEKYNLITLYKRLNSLKFKQAKMVSDLFPKQVQRKQKAKGSTSSSARSSARFLLAEPFPFGTRSEEDASSAVCLDFVGI